MRRTYTLMGMLILVFILTACGGSDSGDESDATTAPTAAPTSTVKPTAEVTAESSPEATPDATATITPEATLEATPEVTTEAAVTTTDAGGADCPALVQTALDAVDVTCSTTGRNQVCYGNLRMQAEGQPDATGFAFDSPGDIVDFDSLRLLELSPMNTTTNEWGVALMRLQADIPDSLPGQSVTFLLFGDVTLENREPGDTDGVQSFYFQTGVGDAQCAAAPESGMLVQTPLGIGQVTFNVNDVNIALGSTAYLQSQPGSNLSIDVVEGQAEVTAAGVTEIVSAGTRTVVPLDPNGAASAPPSAPEPYVVADLQRLPTTVLERPVTIAEVTQWGRFRDGGEGWGIAGESTNFRFQPADATSDGYICAEDGSVDDDWYFEAPGSWLGDRSELYGGDLLFVLRQDGTGVLYDAPDVILEGAGLTLHYAMPQYPGEDWTRYRVALRESAGWVVANSGDAPTAEQMQDVLAGLTSVRIRGEYRLDEDTGCMDAVELVHGVQSTSPARVPVRPQRVAEGQQEMAPVGLVQSGEIETQGEVDTFTITAQPGQVVYFDSQTAETGFWWKLEAPDGAVLFNNNSLFEGLDPGVFVLEQGGDYTITVTAINDETTGPYAFQIWDVPPPDMFVIQPGDVVDVSDVGGQPSIGAGQIESPGAEDLYTLELFEPLTIYFETLGQEGSMEWELIVPDGSTLFDGQPLWVGADPGAFELEPGVYSIMVRGRFGETGSYSFQLHIVPQPDVFEVELGAEVSDGDISGEEDEAAGRIESVGAFDIYTFTVETAQDVYFAARGEETRIEWSLTAPDGATLFEDRRMWDSNDPGAFSLPPGDYTITVHGDGAGIGFYGFAVLPVSSAETFTLEVGDQVADGTIGGEEAAGAGNIEGAGASDVYTFTLDEGQEIYFAAEGEETEIEWTLEAPDGAVMFGPQRMWLGNDPGNISLGPGEFTITVRGEEEATGSYGFQLYTVPVPDVFLMDVGTQISDGFMDEGEIEGVGRIESPGAVDFFRFTVEETDEIYFAAQGEETEIIWDVLLPDGEYLFSGRRLWYGNDPGAFTLEPGEYVIVVRGDRTAFGGYGFQLFFVPETQTFTIPVTAAVSDGLLNDEEVEGIGRIEEPGGMDIYTLEVDEAQEIYFAAQGEETEIGWSLIDPAGDEVFSSQRMWAGNDPGVLLLEPGEYTITVRGDRAEFGSYDFQLFIVPDPQTFAITTSAIVSDGLLGEEDVEGIGRIEEPGSQDVFTFVIEEAQEIYFDSVFEETNMLWTLTGPDPEAEPFFENRRMYDANDPGVLLLEPGEYTLTVRGRQADTGFYAFELFEAPEPEPFTIEIGDIVGPGEFEGEELDGVGVIESPGARDVFTLVLDDEETLTFAALGELDEGQIVWALLDPEGEAVFDNLRLWDGNDQESLTLAAGTYTIVVTGQLADSGGYSFEIRRE